MRRSLPRNGNRTEDARWLGVISARYKFVANLLAGRHDVCELGRSHPLGVRLVLPKVKKIAVYDRDGIFIESIRRRNQTCDGRWKLMSMTSFENLCQERMTPSIALMCLKYVAPEHEEDFVRHVRDSLSRNYDVAIIGCPSPDHDNDNMSDWRKGTHLHQNWARAQRIDATRDLTWLCYSR